MASAAVVSPSLLPSLSALRKSGQETDKIVNLTEKDVKPINGAVITKADEDLRTDNNRQARRPCILIDSRTSSATCDTESQSHTRSEETVPQKRKLDAETVKPAESPKRRSRLSPKARSLRSPTTSASEPSQQMNTSSLPQHYLQARVTHIGLTTEVEPSLLFLSTENSAFSNQDYEQRGSSFFLTNREAVEGLVAVQPAIIQNLESTVGLYGPKLVDFYSEKIKASFPVLDQSFFIDYHEGRFGNLDPSVLAAVYAVSSQWLVLDEITFQPLPNATQLDELAFTIFSSSLRSPSIGTIQAGLLLMQRPAMDLKTLNSQLVNAAYELGLHLDCALWNISQEEKGLRKRLAWALYMQDKWCSLIFGRPSLILNGDWIVRDLGENDFEQISNLSRGQIQNGHLLFRQLVRLTRILSSILEIFCTLKAVKEVEESGNNGTSLILERAKPVQISLREWFGKLPTELKLDSTVTVENPNAIGFLHLAYFATEITLHRCIIRSLQTTGTGAYLTHICRSAAKTRLISAMDFVNRLREEHLRAFWYFPSRISFALIGTFGSLLLATAPCQEEVDFYRTRLGEYRWTLGVSSRNASFLTFAIESLDQYEDLLTNLPEKPRTAEITPTIAGKHDSGSMSLSEEENMLEYDDQDSALMTSHQMLASGPSGLMSPSSSTESGSTYDAIAGGPS